MLALLAVAASLVFAATGFVHPHQARHLVAGLRQLAVMTPLPLLVTAVPGFVLMLRDGWRERDPWLIVPVVLFVIVVLAGACSATGVRHVLVIYPFMALGGAYALARTWHWLADRRKRVIAIPGMALVAGLVLWQAGSLWTGHPESVADPQGVFPFSEKSAYPDDQVLTDSDLQWGVDLGGLERRLAELKVPHLSLKFLGGADLPGEPAWKPLKPMDPVKGWVEITELASEHDPEGYAWLSKYRPVEHIGKTIDLYHLK